MPSYAFPFFTFNRDLPSTNLLVLDYHRKRRLVRGSPAHACCWYASVLSRASLLSLPKAAFVPWLPSCHEHIHLLRTAHLHTSILPLTAPTLLISPPSLVSHGELINRQLGVATSMNTGNGAAPRKSLRPVRACSYGALASCLAWTSASLPRESSPSLLGAGLCARAHMCVRACVSAYVISCARACVRGMRKCAPCSLLFAQRTRPS